MAFEIAVTSLNTKLMVLFKEIAVFYLHLIPKSASILKGIIKLCFSGENALKDCNNELTIGDLLLTDVKVEEIKTAIKEFYKINYPTSFILKMTLERYGLSFANYNSTIIGTQ